MEFVQLQKALQFVNGMRVVIHAQIDEAVIEPAVSAAWAYHKQYRRLLSPAISPGCLACSQCRNQAITKVPLCLLEGVGHREYRFLSYQDIALACVMLSNVATSPWITFIAREGRGCALDANNTYLAHGPPVIVTCELLHCLAG